MPRQARQKSKSGIYHVMLRGNNRATIFHDDEDCARFLEDLRKCLPGDVDAGVDAEGGQTGVESPQWGQSLCPTCGVKNGQSPLPALLYAYCLMGNHVHLLLREGSEDISRMMKRVGIRFASFYKWKYQYSGHVFQDRFRSEPVNDDKYFLAVYRYIVLNPVKAGLAGEIGDYRWCSYRAAGRDFAGRDGSFLPRAWDEKTVPPASDPRWGLSIRHAAGGTEGLSPAPGDSAFPVDITPEQLEAFIRSVQPELHPFRERISDREAEAVLRQITGLDSAAAFVRLPKPELRRLIPLLYDNDLSIPQIARLTGIAKSNIARYLG